MIKTIPKDKKAAGITQLHLKATQVTKSKTYTYLDPQAHLFYIVQSTQKNYIYKESDLGSKELHVLLRLCYLYGFQVQLSYPSCLLFLGLSLSSFQDY